jgi:hypothetical protein
MPAQYETDAQKIVVDWLRHRGLQCFSVPNGAQLGGHNKWGQLAKLKNEGLLPGAPDLVLMRRAPDGRPACLEMKRKTGSKVSDAQKHVAQKLRDAGWVVLVARGADDAIEQLTELYGL